MSNFSVRILGPNVSEANVRHIVNNNGPGDAILGAFTYHHVAGNASVIVKIEGTNSSLETVRGTFNAAFAMAGVEVQVVETD